MYSPTTTKLAILFMPLLCSSSSTFRFLLFTLGSSTASFSTESASLSPFVAATGFFFFGVVPVCFRIAHFPNYHVSTPSGACALVRLRRSYDVVWTGVVEGPDGLVLLVVAI